MSAPSKPRRHWPHSHVVSAVAIIDAPADRVYGIIADYRTGHPAIVPDTFSDLSVEAGGVGAGTIIRFRMRVMGRKQTFRAAVSEPDPGRVLVETDLDTNGAITTFTVTPNPSGPQCEVRITTELPVHSGLLGALQRFLMTRFLQPLYMKELGLLARRAAGN